MAKIKKIVFTHELFKVTISVKVPGPHILQLDMPVSSCIWPCEQRVQPLEAQKKSGKLMTALK